MAEQFAVGFPNAPFLGPDGDISHVWRNFMLVLLTRTGGASGVSSTTTGLAAEVSARIAGDAALDVDIGTEATARAAADGALGDRIDGLTRTIATGQASTDLSVASQFASEQAARILGDTVLANDIANLEVLELLVNGDVPVGIMCNPDGTPIYVPVVHP